MQKKGIFLILILIFFNLLFVSAEIPRTLNLHGKLMNSAGSILTGTYTTTFKIYNSSSGGNELWNSGSLAITTDSSGIYNTILTVTNLSFSEQYYLGITVNGDSEMIPRINMTSSPYSFSTRNITLSGTLIDTNFNLGNFNLTTLGGWLNGGVSILGGNIYSNGTGNNYFLGNVGIGTTSPTKMLDVRGSGNFSGTIFLNNVTDISTYLRNFTLDTYNNWNTNWLSTYNATYASYSTFNNTLNLQTILNNSNMYFSNLNATTLTISNYINMTSTGITRYFSNSCYELSNSTGVYWIC